MNRLSCIEIESALPIKKSVIWLHGLGADGRDFTPVVNELNLPSSLGVRFIFPDAPIMPITFNQGYAMRAWFDIYALNLTAKVDIHGISASISAVSQLIENEIARGMAAEDIFLGGFSQGSTIALSTGLTYGEPLAGIIALSGYLPNAEEVMQKTSEANRQIPIFLAHGTEDMVVPYVLGKEICDLLRQENFPVTWHSYPMMHSVCIPEIEDISLWLQQQSSAQVRQK